MFAFIVPLLEDASTPERSASALCELLTQVDVKSGEVYGFDGSLSRRVWQGARDHEFAARVLDESLELLTEVSSLL